MRVKLGDHWWRRVRRRRIVLDGEPHLGKCDYRRRQIVIGMGLSARNEMATDIHESVHAICPWLDETIVEQIDEQLTVLLFDKLKYRRIEQ